MAARGPRNGQVYRWTDGRTLIYGPIIHSGLKELYYRNMFTYIKFEYFDSMGAHDCKRVCLKEEIST